jgi:hypothetical protein
VSILTTFKEVWNEVPWVEVGLAVAGLWLMTQLYRMHRDEENRFLLSDMVMSPKGRADLYKLIVIVMAGLSVFTVLKLLEAEKPVETLLLGVLGIFVGGRAFTAAFGKEDAPPPADEIKPEEGK